MKSLSLFNLIIFLIFLLEMNISSPKVLKWNCTNNIPADTGIVCNSTYDKWFSDPAKITQRLERCSFLIKYKSFKVATCVINYLDNMLLNCPQDLLNLRRVDDCDIYILSQTDYMIAGNYTEATSCLKLEGEEDTEYCLCEETERYPSLGFVKYISCLGAMSNYYYQVNCNTFDPLNTYRIICQKIKMYQYNQPT